MKRLFHSAYPILVWNELGDLPRAVPTFGSHNAMTIARISRLAALSPLLIESLRKQGVEFEQIVIPDEVHDLISVPQSTDCL